MTCQITCSLDHQIHHEIEACFLVDFIMAQIIVPNNWVDFIVKVHHFVVQNFGFSMVSCIDIHFRAGSILTSTRRINPDRSITRFVPKGSSVDIFEKKALMKINSDSCDDFDREHVVPVLFKQYQAKIAGAEELKSYGVDVDQIKAVSIDTHQDYKEACQRVNTENNGLLS